jgi:hypothetical protein
MVNSLTSYNLWDFKFSRRRVWCSELSSGLYCRNNHFTRQYNPEDSSECLILCPHARRLIQRWSSGYGTWAPGDLNYLTPISAMCRVRHEAANVLLGQGYHTPRGAAWSNDGMMTRRRENMITCEISGSNGGEYEEESVLGYNAVQSRSRPTFQRCLLPP